MTRLGDPGHGLDPGRPAPGRAQSMDELRPAGPVPAEFQISQSVIDAALEWPIRWRSRGNGGSCLACSRCEQSIVTLVQPTLSGVVDANPSYQLTSAQIGTQVIAHLMVRHNWTRESVGDRE